MENYILNYMYLNFSFLLQNAGSFRTITEYDKLCMFFKIIKYNYVCDKKELLFTWLFGVFCFILMFFLLFTAEKCILKMYI